MLQNGLKLLFARLRPDPFFGVPPDNYSFPSGHALSAMCLLGTLVLLAWGRVKDPVGRGVTLAAATATIAGIGWSRVYLGVHYPSDVVGGYVIGALWIGLLAAIGQLRFEQPAPMTATSPSPAVQGAADAGGRVLVVIGRNPGVMRDRPAMQATLRERLAIVGLSPIFADLEAPDLSEWIAKASADGCRAIVAAGGDGTISRVGQDLVDGTVPLDVIPLGTMNQFAKDIGVPTDDIDGAAATLAAGHIRRIDVGEVNGHYFLCGSILGLPARLAQYRRRGDTWWESFLIWTRFLRAFLRALLRYRPLRANLFVAERTIRVRASSMIITPNKINDERGPVFGRGDLEGGRFAVYVFGRLHVADVVRLALRALFHRWQKDQRVTEYEVGRLGIVARSPGLRVMNDGETLILRPPLRYRLLPRALPGLCPPPKPEVPVSDVR